MRRSLLRKDIQGGLGFGNALLFNSGSSQYVGNVDNGVSLTTWTASCWFNANLLLDRTIFGHDTSSQVYIQITNENTISIGAGGVVAFSVPTINTGEWYHLMISSDNQAKRCYINGVESQSGELTGGSFGFRFMRIAAKVNARHFDGKLDEVVFWDNVIGSQQNAIDLYNSGNWVDASSIISSPSQYYQLNESGTDTIAVDSSGNGNNGTLTNFPASGMWIPH